MAEHGITGYRRGCRCIECKAAICEYNRKWREANREKDREYHRKRYAANPEKQAEASRKWITANPEKMVAARRKRREANPEKARKACEYNRKWREANPEKVAENNLRWYTANPDRVRAKNHARRAREMNAFVEHVCPETVYERDNWTCHICGEQVDREQTYPDPLSVSLDHVIPLAKGGEHSYANCATSHLRCNLRKHAKMAG